MKKKMSEITSIKKEEEIELNKRKTITLVCTWDYHSWHLGLSAEGKRRKRATRRIRPPPY